MRVVKRMGEPLAKVVRIAPQLRGHHGEVGKQETRRGGGVAAIGRATQRVGQRRDPRKQEIDLGLGDLGRRFTIRLLQSKLLQEGAQIVGHFGLRHTVIIAQR